MTTKLPNPGTKSRDHGLHSTSLFMFFYLFIPKDKVDPLVEVGGHILTLQGGTVLNSEFTCVIKTDNSYSRS